jgi:hypothetical protein
MLKTDSTGSFDWLRIYGGAGVDAISHQVQTADTGYVLCGNTDSYDTQLEAGYLLKTNSYGESGCHDRAAEFRMAQKEFTAILIDTLHVENVDSVRTGELSISSETSTLYDVDICATWLEQTAGYLPAQLELKQNYPNPFNPVTQIEYSLPGRAKTSLKIYNIQGRQVRALFENQVRARGDYLVEWDGTDDHGGLVASGTYFYQLETDGLITVRKMILVR